MRTSAQLGLFAAFALSISCAPTTRTVYYGNPESDGDTYAAQTRSRVTGHRQVLAHRKAANRHVRAAELAASRRRAARARSVRYRGSTGYTAPRSRSYSRVRRSYDIKVERNGQASRYQGSETVESSN